MQNNVIPDNKRKSLDFRVGINISGANVSVFDDIEDKNKGLDIDFKIIKTNDSNPDSSTITIWNTDKQLFNKLKKSEAIELYTAFGIENYKLTFRGTIDNLQESPFQEKSNDKPDIPTIITCYDIGLTLENAFINKSYKGVISSKIIIEDCLGIMNLPIGKIEIKGDYVSLKDYIARGRCIEVLKELVKRNYCYFNISNGFFNMTEVEKTPDTFGIILNKENSSFPEKMNDGWKIRTGLLPFLLVNTYCFLDFDNLKSTKRIEKIEHIGNNYGTQGETTIYVK